MKSPDQALILCGGRGERLRPLTDSLPKPMAPVNGRPFLAHLIEQLLEQGVRRFVLCTGYLGEAIRRHFGDGTGLGAAIRYSDGPAEWDTGRRVFEARGLLDARFMLMYSDNFIPFSLPRLARFHEASGRSLTLTITPKERGNIRLNERGQIDCYDSSRAAENLRHVELGYMIAEREIFGCFERPDVSFTDVIRRLVSQERVAGFENRDAYYSISDLERLRLAERYLEPKKILLIDRDGTINRKAPRGEYVRAWDEFEYIPETVEAMKALAAGGHAFIVISNQAGIGRGVLAAAAVEDINRRMVENLAQEGIRILGVYTCPHHWEDGCYCRKPSPGLFFQASREHLFRLDRTFYIGDDPRDCQAAANANTRCIYLGEEGNLSRLAPDEKPAHSFRNLKEALPVLL